MKADEYPTLPSKPRFGVNHAARRVVNTGPPTAFLLSMSEAVLGASKRGAPCGTYKPTFGLMLNVICAEPDEAADINNTATASETATFCMAILSLQQETPSV